MTCITSFFLDTRPDAPLNATIVYSVTRDTANVVVMIRYKNDNMVLRYREGAWVVERSHADWPGVNIMVIDVLETLVLETAHLAVRSLPSPPSSKETIASLMDHYKAILASVNNHSFTTKANIAFHGAIWIAALQVRCAGRAKVATKYSLPASVKALPKIFTASQNIKDLCNSDEALQDDAIDMIVRQIERIHIERRRIARLARDGVIRFDWGLNHTDTLSIARLQNAWLRAHEQALMALLGNSAAITLLQQGQEGGEIVVDMLDDSKGRIRELWETMVSFIGDRCGKKFLPV